MLLGRYLQLSIKMEFFYERFVFTFSKIAQTAYVLPKGHRPIFRF